MENDLSTHGRLDRLDRCFKYIFLEVMAEFLAVMWLLR